MLRTYVFSESVEGIPPHSGWKCAEGWLAFPVPDTTNHGHKTVGSDIRTTLLTLTQKVSTVRDEDLRITPCYETLVVNY